MAVKLVPLTCPTCGGQLQIPDGINRCYCTFCGTQIVVDDGTTSLNIHDEADIIRARAEQERQMRLDEQAARQLEKYEAARARWRIGLIVWLVVFLALVVLDDTVTNVAPDFEETYLVFSGGVLVFGPIALFLLRPKKVK